MQLLDGLVSYQEDYALGPWVPLNAQPGEVNVISGFTGRIPYE